MLVAAAIGVTIPLLAFRWFTPNELFPVAYRRGRSAHLDIQRPEHPKPHAGSVALQPVAGKS